MATHEDWYYYRAIPAGKTYSALHRACLRCGCENEVRPRLTSSCPACVPSKAGEAEVPFLDKHIVKRLSDENADLRRQLAEAKDAADSGIVGAAGGGK